MTRPLAAGLLLLAACGGPAPGAPVEQLTIPPGSTLQAVADTLVAHGVIAHPTWFRLLARARRSDRRLQAGIYEFLRGERSWDVIDALVAGRGKLVRFTLPEGLTVREAAAVAERELAIPADSFLAAARDTALVHGAGLDAPSLEGFLYPETYLVPPTVTASDLAAILARAAAATWTPARDARLDSLGMTRLEAVTLASIVEGEARAEEERAVIAAVYHNRLKLGMALQADPTVAYGIELKTGVRKSRLYQRDYQFPSPYNTYLHPGLPPGPINSPGAASLEAVLYPATVPYLFFVAGPDGRHVFSRTYREHLRAIRGLRAPNTKVGSGN